jgi:hypothetical protein
MSDQTDNLRQFARQHGVAPDSARQSGKPKIMLPGGRVKISDTARALFGVIAPKRTWFHRGGAVVLLTQENRHSLPVAQILKATKARSEAEEHADFYTQGKTGPTPGVMSEDTAKAILESSVAKELLPNLAGLINCPLAILHEGQFHVLQTGYDARTGLYVTGSAAKEPATVEEAATIIMSVIADFSFQTAGDISRAIALILTPMLYFGGFLRTRVPIEIIEADDSQTGKGYFLLLRCAIYGEVPTYVAPKKGGVGSLDESFASSLVKGRPFPQFDNFRDRLDSPYLESFLTADTNFSVRIPHTGEMYIDPSRFIISVTSNGLETTKDLANRSCFVRLEKQHNHTFQRFGNDDILATIRRHQPLFVGAVIKVIRHWFEQGMPRTNENRHTFRDWAQTNDWIVQNIFHQAPLLDGHSEAQQRVQDSVLSFARLLAIEVHNRHQLGIALTATEIFDICENGDIPIPGFREQPQDSEFGKKAVGKTMTKLFGNNDEVAIESYVITRAQEVHKTAVGNPQTMKQYTFTRADEQPA